MTLSIYLAGPDVFFPNASEVGARKVALCRDLGFEAPFPHDGGAPAAPTASGIYRACLGLMQRTDIGLFNLTPYRGPSADPGTVFELGFLVSAGKPVYGYSSATASFRDRIEALSGPLVEREGLLRDRDGHSIDNFGLIDNLMIDEAIRAAGGAIVTAEEPSDDPLAAFEAFGRCLEKVRRDRAQGPRARSKAPVATDPRRPTSP